MSYLVEGFEKGFWRLYAMSDTFWQACTHYSNAGVRWPGRSLRVLHNNKIIITNVGNPNNKENSMNCNTCPNVCRCTYSRTPEPPACQWVSTDFTTPKVGQRVRITENNGDVFEFLITGRVSDRISSASHAFYKIEVKSVELWTTPWEVPTEPRTAWHNKHGELRIVDPFSHMLNSGGKPVSQHIAAQEGPYTRLVPEQKG